MRKSGYTAAATALALALFSSVAMAGTGTSTNWSLGLTVSQTVGATEITDLMPVVIGESSTSDELLKPPPLPGKAITGSADDTRISAYLLTSSSRKAARSLGLAGETAVGRVWAVQIETEEPGSPISLSLDKSAFFDDYRITIINPDATVDAEKRIKYSRSEVKKTVISSPAAKSTIYVMVGKADTFTVASGGKVYGTARILNGVEGKVDGIRVFIDRKTCLGPMTGAGCEGDAATDASGIFQANIAPGTHEIRMRAPYSLGSKCTLTVDASGAGTAACEDVIAGDIAAPFGIINTSEMGAFKPVFMCNKNSTEDRCKPWDEKKFKDLTGDGQINMSDVQVLKVKFGKKDTIDD